jgi:hypothetical protein
LKSTTTNLLRTLPAVVALSAACWGMSAYAQATPAEKPAATESVGTAAKKAVKATAEAGGKVVDKTKEVAGKAGAAVTRTGEKIGDKLPQTKAYKKKNKGKKPKSQPVTPAG